MYRRRWRPGEDLPGIIAGEDQKRVNFWSGRTQEGKNAGNLWSKTRLALDDFLWYAANHGPGVRFRGIPGGRCGRGQPVPEEEGRFGRGRIYLNPEKKKRNVLQDQKGLLCIDISRKSSSSISLSRNRLGAVGLPNGGLPHSPIIPWRKRKSVMGTRWNRT
jgi:hypothetical protein